MQRCPYPNCNHIGSSITKYHCVSEHGMERDLLFQKYGIPFNMNSKNTFIMGVEASFANGYYNPNLASKKENIKKYIRSYRID